jgi:hypothetical protein
MPVKPPQTNNARCTMTILEGVDVDFATGKASF